MISRFIILISFVGSCYASSLKQHNGVDLGDHGIPLIPAAHSYNASLREFAFARLNDGRYVSVQSMRDAGINNEQISLKPQYAVFNGVAQHFFNGNFDIGISANCDVTVTTAQGKNAYKFSEYTNFHDPDRISPDKLHLGINQNSPTAIIEYNVVYSNGRGTPFAASKNGTRQIGIIFLLDDIDMKIWEMYGISYYSNLNEILFVLNQIPSMTKNGFFQGIMKSFGQTDPTISKPNLTQNNDAKWIVTEIKNLESLLINSGQKSIVFEIRNIIDELRDEGQFKTLQGRDEVWLRMLSEAIDSVTKSGPTSISRITQKPKSDTIIDSLSRGISDAQNALKSANNERISNQIAYLESLLEDLGIDMSELSNVLDADATEEERNAFYLELLIQSAETTAANYY